MHQTQKIQPQSQTTNFYIQLFQLSPKQVLHNESQKQVHQNKPSQMTEYLLTKIKDSSDKPWSLLEHIPQLINEFLQTYSPPSYNNPGANPHLYRIQGSVHFVNPELIFLGNGTVIEHGSMISGPCIIGQNCQLRKGSYIRGNVILGDNTLLGNSSQVKNAILMDSCQISHLNYIGDSILGMNAHFSAGATTSNYKLDGSEIKIGLQIPASQDVSISNAKVQKNKRLVTTGRNKLGALVGHNAQIGCNSILNPGSVIGKNSVIYPLVSWRGQLGSFKICKLIQQNIVVEKL